MQLIEIAKALAHESKLLVLDEPTATLTSKEVDRLFEILHRLKERKVTTLYISHRLQEIYEVGDRVTVLRDGQHVTTQPLRDLGIPDIVRLMVGRASADQGVFREDTQPSGEALAVEDLRLTATSPPSDLSVAKGEIVGIAGLVGSGRTEAVRAIFGADPKAAGTIRVNERDFTEYFPTLSLQNDILRPLEIANSVHAYDLRVSTNGGGINGQSGALRLGIARALLDAGEYRDELKKAGYLTRDSRAVERKKYGLKKARKRPQFSKR